MDFLCEQTVHKKRQPKDILYKLLIISMVFLIPTLCAVIGVYTNTYYCFVVAFFLLLFCIYGAWYFWTSLRIDFEYSVMSGVLSVSKIIDNRKRKSLMSVEIRTIEQLELYNPEKHDNYSYETVYFAAGDKGDEYAAVFPLKERKGMCMLIFSPNEKVLAAMKRHLRIDLRSGI